MLPLTTQQSGYSQAIVPVQNTSTQFLTNNWKQMLAKCGSSIRCIKVVNKVATLVNAAEGYLIRTPVNALDGFYGFGSGDSLVPKTLLDWLPYPDVTTAEPRWDQLCTTREVHRAEVLDMLAFVEHVLTNSNAYNFESTRIAICKSGIMDAGSSMQFQLNFDLPFLPGFVKLGALPLKYVLTEMLRYDSIILGLERRINGEPPMFFGKDWSACGLILPKSYGNF